MEILVCIKQVPGTSKVEVDPVTGVLKRDGIDSMDLFQENMELDMLKENICSINMVSNILA